MKSKDVRWVQRFSNFKKALSQLEAFVKKASLSNLEEQGLIKVFEYTYELGWNTLKDFYESQGESNIQGSRDAIRLAFKRGLIRNGDAWMDMVQSRIQTAHSYNEKVAKEIVRAILKVYFSEFLNLKATLESHE